MHFLPLFCHQVHFSLKSPVALAGVMNMGYRGSEHTFAMLDGAESTGKAAVLVLTMPACHFKIFSWSEKKQIHSKERFKQKKGL